MKQIKRLGVELVKQKQMIGTRLSPPLFGGRWTTVRLVRLVGHFHPLLGLVAGSVVSSPSSPGHFPFTTGGGGGWWSSPLFLSPFLLSLLNERLSRSFPGPLSRRTRRGGILLSGAAW